MRIARVLSAVSQLAPAELARLKEAFDPDETRDAHGRWGSGGAGSPQPDPALPGAHRRKPPPKKPPKLSGSTLTTTTPAQAAAQAAAVATQRHQAQVLHALQGHLNIVDGQSSYVKGMLAAIGLMPVALAQALAARGMQLYIGDRSIMQLDDMATQLGAAGARAWNEVAGVALPEQMIAAAGTPNSGENYARTTVLHEIGHLVGFNPALNPAGTGALDQTSEWKSIHAAQYANLDPYYQQDGPGGQTGCEEMFAETFALAQENILEARTDFGNAAVNYVERATKLTEGHSSGFYQ